MHRNTSRRVGDAAARQEFHSKTTPANSQIANKSQARRAEADALIVRLAERFPNTFVLYQHRRQPIKIGIHSDLIAALDDAVSPAELSTALAIYTGATGYLLAMRTGAERLDLEGKPAGVVTRDEQQFTRERLANRSKRPPPAPPPSPAPQRLSLRDLKAASVRRRQAEGAS